jgi:hypothetical protein
VVTSFPPLDRAIYEDVVLPFRASLLGDVVFIDEPLIRARRHAASLTANFDQFASLAGYRARMQRGMAKVRAQLGSRLADIDVARRREPGREAEWQELERIARASLADAEKTVPLWSDRAFTRWAAFTRLALARLHGRDLMQNAAIAFAPEAYLRYKRQRLMSHQPSQELAQG